MQENVSKKDQAVTNAATALTSLQLKDEGGKYDRTLLEK